MSWSETIIRPFKSFDAQAVNAAASAAFAQYQDRCSDWDSLQKGVSAMASLSNHADIIVAERDGQVVGAVAYCAPGSTPRAEFFRPEYALIRMLVVRPETRGQGCGRRLAEECVRRARQDGAPSISLHTSPVMEAAQALYLGMGFELEQLLPDRFGLSYSLYRLCLS